VDVVLAIDNDLFLVLEKLGDDDGLIRDVAVDGLEEAGPARSRAAARGSISGVFSPKATWVASGYSWRNRQTPGI
jgi:hypothetical protein